MEDLRMNWGLKMPQMEVLISSTFNLSTCGSERMYFTGNLGRRAWPVDFFGDVEGNDFQIGLRRNNTMPYYHIIKSNMNLRHDHLKNQLQR